MTGAASPVDTWNAAGVTALTTGEKTEMYHLLERHFAGVSWEQFERDLAEKTEAIIIRRKSVLLGFTTLEVRESTYLGQRITVIYSGDTIVDPVGWNSPTLARAWIAAVNRWRTRHPNRKCFWILLTSGYRTYRFLPVFWREYYPCTERATPLILQELRDTLATEKYGAYFDPETGIVRFPRPQKLRGRLAEIPAARERNADVAFFLSRNPDHAKGDELVCLTEIDEKNLTRAGRRMVAPR